MTSAVSDFYANDIRNYNASHTQQEYMAQMESLEAELLALDNLLEAKATKDNKRSDFRKNVTMKAGRGLRKMLGFSEGRRDTLEKNIKKKEEEWKALVKLLYAKPTKSKRGYYEDNDKKLKEALENFKNDRERKKSIIHTIDSTKKMSRKERERYKYDTRYLEPANLTSYGSEDDMTVSLGGRRRRRTRKRRRKKRTKKRGKKRRRKRTRRK